MEVKRRCVTQLLCINIVEDVERLATYAGTPRSDVVGVHQRGQPFSISGVDMR